jgi:hypothetical protein
MMITRALGSRAGYVRSASRGGDWQWLVHANPSGDRTPSQPYTDPMPHDVLQRDDWNRDAPMRVDVVFQLHKGKKQASCELWKHPPWAGSCAWRRPAR